MPGGLRVSSLRDLKTGREFLARTPLPLFSLRLRHVPSGRETQLSAASGWRNTTTEAKDPLLAIQWEGRTEDGPTDLRVVATLRADGASHAIRWNLSVRGLSGEWSLLRAVFPQISLAELGPNAAAFFPRAPGEVKHGVWRRPFRHQGLYPEPWTTMQYLAAYDAAGEAGLYVACHDPTGSPKEISIASAPDQAALTFTFDHPTANMTRPSNDFKLPGEVVWQLLRGDWFDATMIYRDWVRREAKWYTRPGPNGRADTPEWMRELPVWATRPGSREEVVPQVKAFAEYMGVPVGFHWYSWHEIPFDNDYPHYLPARPGFSEGVAELQKSGVRVMPYINGRLWDTRDKGAEDFEFTRVARPAATKDEKGEPYHEEYGSKEADGSAVRFAVMCPATELWQKRVGDVCLRLFNEHKVDAVYIDQVAAMSPRLCMDTSHGHPLGGGEWWNQGYWKMLGDIRKAMPPGAMLTTECNSEPFTNVFDGYLSWTWQHDGQVPAFQAVYAGAIQSFGRAYREGPTRDLALRMKAGQQLVFGEQLGWIHPAVIEQKENAEFLRDAVRLRWALRRYFSAGEMARPPRLEGSLPKVEADWQWSGVWPVTTDAVLAGAWRLPQDGKLLLIFANVSDQAVVARLNLEPQTCGLAPGPVQLTRWTSRGPDEPLPATLPLEKELRFEPRSTWAWELR